jgi:hypothetical protein
MNAPLRQSDAVRRRPTSLHRPPGYSPGKLNFAKAPISNVAMVNSTCWGHLCEDYY